MPDTPEHRYWNGHGADCLARAGPRRMLGGPCTCGFRDLLDRAAHIDALTAAAQDVVTFYDEWKKGDEQREWWNVVDPLRAILRGEKGALDVSDPAVREAQVYGGDDRARQVDER